MKNKSKGPIVDKLSKILISGEILVNAAYRKSIVIIVNSDRNEMNKFFADQLRWNNLSKKQLKANREQINPLWVQVPPNKLR